MMNKVTQDMVLKLIKSKDILYSLIDVRERTEYNKKQILFAINIPKSQVEFRISKLVPVKDTQIILYDNDESRSTLVAKTLGELGYTNVDILKGGLNQWEGHNEYLINGVNVPSKAFAEIVYEEEHVPDIEAHKLYERMQKGENDFTVIEIRPREEVNITGSIPGAINITGVDIIHSIHDYVDNEKDLIITCAGRTRGIIGTQILRKMGFQNVYNLRNGTMGWLLANQELDDNIPLVKLSCKSNSSKLDSFINQVIDENNIELISLDCYQDLRNASDHQTLFEIDVRTPLEYEEGHIPGTYKLPGGQVIQATDDHIGVRNGNIVLISNSRHRAVITAYWLKESGYPKVMVLDGGIELWKNSNLPIEKGEVQDDVPLGYNTSYKKGNRIVASELKERLESDSKLIVIDIDTSKGYQKGHIPNSLWLSRSWLEFNIREVAKESDMVILTDRNGYSSTLSAKTLKELGYEDVYVLEGGKKAWSEAGYTFENGKKGIIKEPDDIAYHPYEISEKAMIDYLEWEIGLEEQFKPLRAIYHPLQDFGGIMNKK
ncbi:Rhodanese-like protein [Neobacillus bataviensis LMG 21833]|uniref:Rhodanese-like protein n=1 Tax=Neobacillus bataviensis LMG 21833 TaxID=1117379 RepID=K6DR21_9BACI|nr:rhodanese-like domain-containing protein [Neobacillus bataviensis]EKN70653.1 Rhodanese-like protein [Neobacillus bataviensis LMG 21833]